jgi:hypothetical protein
MQHIDAPLLDGKMMTLDVLRQKNAELARAWPAPVRIVHLASSDVNASSSSSSYPPVSEASGYGTYLSEQGPNREAEKLIAKVKADASRQAIAESMDEGGLAQGFVALYRAGSRRGRL